jgi:hypothetical protein
MKHLIEFRATGSLTLEESHGTTTKTMRVNIRAGVQCPANVRCYVVKNDGNYIEVADVEVEEGLLRAIPCSCFMFIDRLG